jgi:Protein of unknown function (DUF1552)
MVITKMAIPRRTVLRGIGATLALPLLDSMVPAFASTQSAATPVKRLGVVYVPNGVVMKNWTPATEGAFELSPTLAPLAPYKDRLLVFSGLNSKPPAGLTGANIGVHARAATRFLTDVPPKHTNNAEILAGVSMDQMYAKQAGQHTQLASLELALEGRDFAGSCDVGYSCAYSNTISWNSPTTPLPMEHNPRVVFERLFGDGGSTEEARLARIRKDRSLLDSVTDKANSLGRRIGASDRAKLSEYLEAVRDIERRIQRAEQQNSTLPVVDQPAGIPAAFADHVKLMFDLQVLAFASDTTRVFAFKLGRDASNRVYPDSGVTTAFHSASHHQDREDRILQFAKINRYHVGMVPYFLKKLQDTPDGDSNLLQNSLVVYGSPMGNSNVHNHKRCPLFLAGHASGQLKGGLNLKAADGTPMANVMLSIAHKLGLDDVDTFGDSTGAFELNAAPSTTIV